MYSSRSLILSRKLHKAICGFLLTFFCLFSAGCVDNSGIVYHDGNRSSVSQHAQGVDPWDQVLSGVEIAFLNRDSEIITRTDARGSFSFGEPEPGAYVVDITGIDPGTVVTTHNRSRRFPQAVREGHLNLVSIGDSLGVYVADVPYPEVLAGYLSEIVDTSLVNLAVSGSTSAEWLPGAARGYFDRRLVPVLPDADIVTITLGGNDVLRYLEDIHHGAPVNLVKLYKLFYEQAIPNVRTVIREIQRINPGCDIVFVIYPNFANNSYVYEYIGKEFQPFASAALKGIFASEREILSGLDGIIYGDMFGAMGDTWMDPYQIDPLHPNERGHQLYAREIFRALGGVVIEPAELIERMYGFHAPNLVN